MTARFFPSLFCSVLWATCLTFLLNVSLASSADYVGPVFPDDTVEDIEVDEAFAEPLPLPLPKRNPNPLLQRPKSKQVVFDDLDPVSSIVPQDFLYEDENNIQPMPVTRQSRPLIRTPKVIGTDTISENNALFTTEKEIIQGKMQPMADVTYDEIANEYPTEIGGYVTGPICQTFGMGLFDNLTLFSEATTFKTEFNNGAGSFGFGEGFNWSTPITPQGTITAQYGIRAVQGDIFSRSARSQCFMTAGIFKRFDFTPVHGGVAVDWLHDHSHFGSVDLRQMRCELSARSFRNLEYGFIGGFDVFQDRPTTSRINRLAFRRGLGVLGGVVDVQDFYLFFVRKHLDSGGQVELRCGSTERGDFIFNALGEVTINDRLAINGGISVLAPSEGHSIHGNYRENWSMSLGIVLYFRGGAIHRHTNLYRPMFDVAGNNSFFTKVVGR